MNNLNEEEQLKARIKELDHLVDELTMELDLKKETIVELKSAFDDRVRVIELQLDDKNKLKEENSKLRQALKFTTKAAVHLFQPEKPLEKGLPPFFYHTTTYEGDLELIENTKLAMELIKDENNI